MIIPILMLGQPSSGKTTSFFPINSNGVKIKGLPVDKMLFINCGGAGKILPHTYDVKSFKQGGQLFFPDSFEMVIKIVEQTVNGRPDIDYIIIDDFGLLSASTISKVQMTFDEWNRHGGAILSVLNEITKPRQTAQPVYIFIIMHTMQEREGLVVSTTSKMVDRRLGGSPVSLFTHVVTIVAEFDEIAGQMIHSMHVRPTAVAPLSKTLIGKFDQSIYPADMGVYIDHISK